MITAKPSRFHRRVFEIYLARLMKKHFHSLHLTGSLPDLDPQLPLLVLPNHSTWWDGFFAWHLNAKLWQRPFFLMMLESQLKKYSFFRGLGAYGINQDNAKGILQSLRYTVKLLNQHPPPMICIFPQGELLPWGRRPLAYRSGIEWIINKYNQPVNVVQLAIATQFLGEQLPEAFFLFGKAEQLTAKTSPDSRSLSERHELLLDDLQLRIEFGDTGEAVLQGRKSIHRTIDAVFRYEDNSRKEGSTFKKDPDKYLD